MTERTLTILKPDSVAAGRVGAILGHLEKEGFRVAGLKPELQPTNEREYRTAARRPKYSALSNAKMERCGIEPMPPLEKAVELYLQARESYFSKK